MLRDDEPEIEEDICDFVVNLLTFCGYCVKLGRMKPIEILHNDINSVKVTLKHSRGCKDMNESYESFISHIKKNNPFIRSN